MSLDDTLAALADPTRRAILAHLARGEDHVTAIAEPFAMSLNSVSKHIRILERAGLVRRRIEGREHFLTFHDKPMREASAWIDRHLRFWTHRLDALEAALRAEDAIAAAQSKARKRSP